MPNNKRTIYDQTGTTLCQTFVIFGAFGALTGQYATQKQVLAWAKKKNIKEGDFTKEGGVSSRDIAELLGLKVNNFFWRDADFYKALYAKKPIILSMRATASFWRDTMDGVLDDYLHARGDGGHAVYIQMDDQGIVWLYNSFGTKIPSCRIDITKFKPEWLKLNFCFTISIPKK